MNVPFDAVRWTYALDGNVYDCALRHANGIGDGSRFLVMHGDTVLLQGVVYTSIAPGVAPMVLVDGGSSGSPWVQLVIRNVIDKWTETFTRKAR